MITMILTTIHDDLGALAKKENPMTYRQLIEELQSLDNDQLNENVWAFDALYVQVHTGSAIIHPNGVKTQFTPTRVCDKNFS